MVLPKIDFIDIGLEGRCHTLRSQVRNEKGNSQFRSHMKLRMAIRAVSLRNDELHETKILRDLRLSKRRKLGNLTADKQVENGSRLGMQYTTGSKPGTDTALNTQE